MVAFFQSFRISLEKLNSNGEPKFGQKRFTCKSHAVRWCTETINWRSLKARKRCRRAGKHLCETFMRNGKQRDDVHTNQRARIIVALMTHRWCPRTNAHLRIGSLARLQVVCCDLAARLDRRLTSNRLCPFRRAPLIFVLAR